MNNVINYGWKNNDTLCSSSYIAPVVLKCIKELKSRRVADLGSGNGHLCSILKKQGLDIVGIERDKKGVEVSRDSYPNIQFYNYGVEDSSTNLLNKERKFDCVVSTEVIEHLYSPHLLPRYAHDILENNGYLIISTPYHGYLKNLVLAILGKWDKHHTPLWHGGHIKFWSKSTIITLLEENGFRYVSFKGADGFPCFGKAW